MAPNFDKIIAHRGVVLTAIKFYKKQLEKIEKLEDDAEVDTDDTARKIEICDQLCAELVDQRSMLLENTPMGDLLTQEHLKADDGSALTVDAMDEMLQHVYIDAPLDHIVAWTLDQRKQVHAWVKEMERHFLDAENVPAPELLDILSPAWITDDDALLERELSQQEIEKWLLAGPWSLRADPAAVSPAEAEWQIIRTVKEVSDEGGPLTSVQIRPDMYAALDRAQLIAANLNALAEGKRIMRETSAASTETPAADVAESVDESAPPQEDEPASVERRLTLS